jgi:hypothetical protein
VSRIREVRGTFSIEEFEAGYEDDGEC